LDPLRAKETIFCEGNELSKHSHGTGEKGRSMNPTELPQEDATPLRQEPRSAPAPGLPISNEDYERMKEEAKNAIGPSESIAQEDRGGRKRKP
jgi:hypothetical protein